MNEWVSIIKKVQKSIVRIVLFSKGEIISEGSGTIINSSGHVLTARHVIEMYDDYIKYNNECIIYVFTSVGRFTYHIISTPFSIGFPITKDKILEQEVDIALLEPDTSRLFTTFLTPVLSSIDVEMGSDLLLCGYSEETPNLIDISQILKQETWTSIPSNIDIKKEISLLENSLKPATFKSGIVAHTTHIYTGNPPIHMQFIHIDNGVHGGMSGGPIIDSQGHFIAIITKRTTICANVLAEQTLLKFDVPSGNSIGITLNFIQTLLSSQTNNTTHE